MFTDTFRPRACIAALSCLLVSLGAAGAQSTTDISKAGVVQALSDLAAAFAANTKSPKEVADMIYAPDIVILGETDAAPTHGMDAAREEVRQFLKNLGTTGTRRCVYDVLDPAVASSTTFSSLVTLHCDANPPTLASDLNVRMVCVWKKLPQGWRIVLEMWAPRTIA